MLRSEQHESMGVRHWVLIDVVATGAVEAGHCTSLHLRTDTRRQNGDTRPEVPAAERCRRGPCWGCLARKGSGRAIQDPEGDRVVSAWASALRQPVTVPVDPDTDDSTLMNSWA